jgi:uncharacterized membrane protein YfcA
MDITWMHAIVLICSGLVVGFINTLAGGGTIISLSVFMFFGLPPVIANGTNRVAVLLQNITAVTNFARHKLIPWTRTYRLSVPIVAGACAGAWFAGVMSNTVFHYLFAAVAVLFATLLLTRPERWLKERADLLAQPSRPLHYLLMFGIGIYCGVIHVGAGYMILALLVLGTGYELLKANAIKNFLVMVYVPFSLLIFAWQGNVRWDYGLVHAIGNIIGAYIGSRVALRGGAPIIRYIMLVLISVVILQLMGVIQPETIAKWLK